jgi:hypothetical protein
MDCISGVKTPATAMDIPQDKHNNILMRGQSMWRSALRIVFVVLVACVFALVPSMQGALHITEFMADNGGILVDADGDSSDWIEIFNSGPETIDLAGYYLTDDSGALTKWQFPSLPLEANAFLLVFASEKDRRDANTQLHTNFRLGNSGEYLALVAPDGATIIAEFGSAANPLTEQFEDISYGLMQTGDTTISVLVAGSAACRVIVPPDASLDDTWRGVEFDDSVWNVAVTGIGYDESSTYRSLFGTNGDLGDQLNGVNTSVYVRIPFNLADAGSVAQLTLKMKYDDGFVAFLNGQRVADSNGSGASSWNSAATGDNPDGNAVIFEDFNLDTSASLLRDGNNVLSIQGLNGDLGSSDMLVLPELHAVRVSNPSIGGPGYMSIPSPGSFNGDIFGGFVSDTSFSAKRGFYDAPFDVGITSTTPDVLIRYTTDSTAPSTSSGTLYTGPISITTTTVLKAIAYKAGFTPTNVDCQTYVFLDDVLRQPSSPPAFPSGPDYGMDSDVVDNPLYSGTIKDDLKSIPSISIAMRTSDLFGGSGIYTNANNSGVAWERPGSVELIFPDGRKDIQINCGVRMQGGVGRNSSFPKHSFRFLFKREYGNTKLKFPLFQDATEDADGAVDSFDSIILRAGFNNSWHRGSSGEENRAQYIRDQFMHDSQLAMGHASCHGTFVHLYLNGLYWGLYNVVERPNADFASSYYGGEKEEWDALNSYPRNVVDGNADAWVTAHSIANAGVSTQAGYDALSEYVDIPNLIDYMLVNFYGGNQDWDDHNWYSARRRLPGEGYKFFNWDAERTLESTTGNNRTGVGQSNKPSRLYSMLRENAEFRLEFADRAHRHLFNGGALTPARTIARYRALADYIDRAIVGESARWGDSKRSNPYTRNVEWVAERDRLLNSYLPQRTAVVLSQLRGADLYPGTDAPVFSRQGGSVSPDTPLTMATDADTIYYTLDGSDPRQPGGAVNLNAQIASFGGGGPAPITYIATGHEWSYLDDGSDQGSAWRSADFDDSGWATGPSELGYGSDGEGSGTTVGFGPDSSEKYTTTYFRASVNIPEPSIFFNFLLRIKYDDGIVVYINGKEALRQNLPVGASFESFASGSVDDEGGWKDFTLSTPELSAGTNVIAVEIHQTSGSSSDIRLDMVLRGETSQGGGDNVSDPLFLSAPTMLRARSYNSGSGEWSALNEAFFTIDTVPADTDNLVISEIHYHPANPSTPEEVAVSSDRDDFEFIEFMNIGSEALELTGAEFEEGVNFTFPDVTIIGVGGRLLLVRDREAFVARYGAIDGVEVFEYTGRMSNDGEQLVLANVAGETIRDFTYNDQDPWPTTADGDGVSLVLIDPESNPDHAAAVNWRAGGVYGGTPGTGEPAGISFEQWAAASGVSGGPGEDEDGDGISNIFAFLFGASPAVSPRHPEVGVQALEISGQVDNYLTLTYQENINAIGSGLSVEISTDFLTWSDDQELIKVVSTTDNGNGSTTVTVRLASPVGTTGRQVFIRLSAH